jgi:hypothetical protein
MTDDERQKDSGLEPDPGKQPESPDFPLPGAERPLIRNAPEQADSSPEEPSGSENKDEEPFQYGNLDPHKLDLGRWIMEGWRLIRNDMVGYIIAALILVSITVIAYKIHPIVWLAVAGPMKAGFFLMTINHMRTGRPLIGDLFQAFTRYIPVTLAMLVMAVFIAAGYLFCLIPGLFLRGIYFFTFLFIVDRGFDFWEAMEASRNVAARDYLEFALLALVLFVINCVGFLFFGIGLFVTIPLSFAAVACAYRELVGLAPEPAIRQTTVPPAAPDN